MVNTEKSSSNLVRIEQFSPTMKQKFCFQLFDTRLSFSLKYTYSLRVSIVFPDLDINTNRVLEISINCSISIKVSGSILSKT